MQAHTSRSAFVDFTMRQPIAHNSILHTDPNQYTGATQVNTQSNQNNKQKVWHCKTARHKSIDRHQKDYDSWITCWCSKYVIADFENCLEESAWSVADL